MSDRSGLSRGDRNRNARLARLRRLLPADHAIVGIDLADDKQAAVVRAANAWAMRASMSRSLWMNRAWAVFLLPEARVIGLVPA
jgi:hypothetical protein